MIIKSRIKEKAVDAAIVLLIFLVASIYSYASHAQTFRPFKYMGFEGSYGIRSFMIESSISQINGMPVVTGGGSLGLIFGNDVLRTKLRGIGYYYSASSVPRTVELFQSEALFNFYPLEYFRKNENALDIYLVGSATMDNIKFFGHYLTTGEKINYSAPEPYLGKVSQFRTSAGLGFEYQLTLNNDFVHFFAEATYGTVLHSATDRESFAKTSISNFCSINAGMSFGMSR